MPRKDDDFDFKIFVDPSCLSEPMNEETKTTSTQLPAEAAATETTDIPVAAEPTEKAPNNDEGTSDSAMIEPQIPDDTEEARDEEPDQGSIEDPHNHSEPKIHNDSAELDAAEQHDSPVPEGESLLEGDSIAEEHVADDNDINDNDEVIGDESVVESTTEEHEDEEPPHADAPHDDEANDRSMVEEDVNDQSLMEEDINDQSLMEDDRSVLQEESQDAAEEGYTEEDAETPKPPRSLHSGIDDDSELKPVASTITDRKTSLRTEALIQAAARAVVAKLEKRSSGRDSTSQVDEEVETSLLSTDSQDHDDHREASFEDSPSQSRRESASSQIRHNIPSSGDEGGDSSSHHEAEDDVFSDRSARSSIGSFDGHSDGAANPKTQEDHLENQSFISRGRSPRISGVSMISGISQYDKEDFVPTSRETRLPFRTPSDIRAIQMSSPTPSVFNGASPRSGKRHTGHSISSVPRSSHFQSPTASAQYSPKGRSTPTRLKPRKVTAPLVLLHVTLLPLRWMWGDVLDGLDPVNGKALDENKEVYMASEQLKTLRDAWRELQDCVGETVLERGVLIPHPQNDFEVLEERLLEALELPLRRRARILECGHYLGPSNIADYEDYESEDDGYTSESTRKEDKRHWCTTCKSDIRYEALGAGRVFRVKVYASNGLMRAGAWEACWKDMERVDVEVEPIVEPKMQAELERLAEIQMRLEDERQREEEERQHEAEAAAEEERRHEEELERELAKEENREEEAVADQTLPVAPEPEQTWAQTERTEPESQTREVVMSSPAPSSMQVAMHASPLQPPYSSAIRADSPALMRITHSSRSMRSEPVDTSEERMRRDEERMREIYGDMPTPQPYSEMGSSTRGEHGSTRPRHPDSYVPSPSPRSPSEEAYERRQQRDARKNLDNASFIDLLLEAFKVLLRDPKNVAIIVLCTFITCVLIRPTPQAPVFPDGQLAYRHEAKQEVVMHTPAARIETRVRPQVDAPAAPPLNGAVVGTMLLESVSNIIMETSAASAAPVISTPSNLLESPVPSLETLGNMLEASEPIEEAPVPEASSPAEEVHTAFIEASSPVEDTPNTTTEGSFPAEETSDTILEALSPSEEPTVPEMAPKDASSELPDPPLDYLSSELDTSAPLESEVPVASLEESVALDNSVEQDSAAVPKADIDAEVASSDVLSDEVAAETISVEASDVSPSDDDATVAVDDVAANQELGGEQGIEVANEAERLVAVDVEAVEVEDNRGVPGASEETIEAAEDVTLFAEPAVGGEIPVNNQNQLTAETTETPVDTDVRITAEHGEPVVDNEVQVSAEVPQPTDTDVPVEADTPGDIGAAPSVTSVDNDWATASEESLSETTHPCESYVQSYMAGDSFTTQHVFPVTQRTTIRVFETITETVMVSVTATSTVSFVETAVPQTVEETVYETETLRVTVSIPVDSTPRRGEL